ncbi:SurA N-terminal domain-containing protein [Acidicapsa acidisoli]|uniref:peptidylprolyl isomerase n=1 Tax=Acidicapsa acidisoli TaxID=1615681 RepID=UPI0021E09B04|nr:peptidylprolyl isomerase [Acidicapsa acidisoli]
MRINATIAVHCAAQAAALLLLICCVVPAHAQADSAPASPEPETAPHAETLDSVVAVVNNQVILASDIDLEMRLFRLLPIGTRVDFTRAKALERMITRTLIEQQILLEDPQGLDVTPKDLEDSLAELRQSLPACKSHDCATAEGWSSYLATLGLTPERVSAYWARRMALLRFIEMRFRSGIRILPDEIRKYYQETLVPKYAKPEDAPSLEKLSPRIQEILLQQKVNVLLGDWVKSLQDQGQVEILDPALRDAAPPESGAEASPSAPAESASPGKGGRP